MLAAVLPAIVIPVLALVVMTVVEGLAKPRPFWEKACDAGWDLCIFGVGLTGGIVVNPSVQQVYGPVVPGQVAIVLAFVNILLGCTVLIVRRRRQPTRGVGLFCAGLGIFAVALPSAFTFWLP